MLYCLHIINEDICFFYFEFEYIHFIKLTKLNSMLMVASTNVNIFIFTFLQLCQLLPQNELLTSL